MTCDRTIRLPAEVRTIVRLMPDLRCDFLRDPRKIQGAAGHEQHVPTDKREEQQQVRADDGYAQRERRFRQLYEEHYLHIQAYAVRRLEVQADAADVAVLGRQIRHPSGVRRLRCRRGRRLSSRHLGRLAPARSETAAV